MAPSLAGDEDGFANNGLPLLNEPLVLKLPDLKLPDDRDAFSDAGSAGERESSEGGDGVATEMSFDLIRLRPDEGTVALPRLVMAMC